ncbi:MAG: hypothetical protein Q9187_007806 [Circinaria calcarea]
MASYDTAPEDLNGMTSADGGVVVENGKGDGTCLVAGERASEEILLPSEEVDPFERVSSDAKSLDIKEHPPSESSLLPHDLPPAENRVREIPLSSSKPTPSTNHLEGGLSLETSNSNIAANLITTNFEAERKRMTQRLTKATAFFRDTAGYMARAMDRIEASEASPEVKLGQMRVWTESCVRKFRKLAEGLQVSAGGHGMTVKGERQGKEGAELRKEKEAEDNKRDGEGEKQVRITGSRGEMEAVTPPKDDLPSASGVAKSQGMPAREAEKSHSPMSLDPTTHTHTEASVTDTEQPANLPQGPSDNKRKERRRRRRRKAPATKERQLVTESEEKQPATAEEQPATAEEQPATAEEEPATETEEKQPADLLDGPPDPKGQKRKRTHRGRRRRRPPIEEHESAKDIVEAFWILEKDTTDGKGVEM